MSARRWHRGLSLRPPLPPPLSHHQHHETALHMTNTTRETTPPTQHHTSSSQATTSPPLHSPHSTPSASPTPIHPPPPTPPITPPPPYPTSTTTLFTSPPICLVGRRHHREHGDGPQVREQAAERTPGLGKLPALARTSTILYGFRLESSGLPRLASSRGWRSFAVRQEGRRVGRPAAHGKRRGRW